MSEENQSKNGKVTTIPKDVPFGLVLWELPDGMYLGNAQGEYLCVGVHWGNMIEAQRRIKRLRDDAAAMGFPEGKPVFRPGTQKVTRYEYDDQMEQLLDGRDIEGDIE